MALHKLYSVPAKIFTTMRLSPKYLLRSGVVAKIFTTMDDLSPYVAVANSEVTGQLSSMSVLAGWSTILFTSEVFLDCTREDTSQALVGGGVGAGVGGGGGVGGVGAGGGVGCPDSQSMKRNLLGPEGMPEMISEIILILFERVFSLKYLYTIKCLALTFTTIPESSCT